MSDYSFVELSEQEFSAFSDEVTHGSFLQRSEMAHLMLHYGWEIYYVAVKSEKIVMAGLLGAKAMTGGKHFELQYGPIYSEKNLEAEEVFYQELRTFVKKRGAIELLDIPNEDYQQRDDKGELSSEKDEKFIARLEKIGYHHSPLSTGYNARGEATWHYVKELSELKTEQALLKSYSKDGQYSVKKTKQFGISVRPMKKEELPIFKEITALTSERRGYDDHDLAYYEELFDDFGENAEFLIAEINFSAYAKDLEGQIEQLQAQIVQLDEEIQESDSAKKKKQRAAAEQQLKAHEKRLSSLMPFAEKYGDQPKALAAALTMYTPAETVYLSSGSYEEFKNFYAPFAIQHFAMKKSIENGVPLYNFFGIQGIFDGSDGVLRFKENFSGFAVQKAGYFTYYPRPIKAKALKLVKKVMGRK